MSLHENHRRCMPILIIFESKIPSLISLSKPVVFSDWDMLRAPWGASKITSVLKFSSTFTKCIRIKEDHTP